jgi:hypothetical protein
MDKAVERNIRRVMAEHLRDSTHGDDLGPPRDPPRSRLTKVLLLVLGSFLLLILLLGVFDGSAW